MHDSKYHSEDNHAGRRLKQFNFSGPLITTNPFVPLNQISNVQGSVELSGIRQASIDKFKNLLIVQNY